MAINFTCPRCNKIQATASGGTFTLNGNVTITGNFPPSDYNSNWAKCSDCNVYLKASGGSSSSTTISSVSLGGRELQPGDWLYLDGSHGGFYKHHTIYVGSGDFVSRQVQGVIRESGRIYEGKKAWLVHRGGQGAANKALSRVGQGGYNLASNNCEHFASDCCGFGHKSEQVKVSSGKLIVTVGSALANALNANPSVRFTSSTAGGFSSMGGFSAGFSIRF